MKSVLTANVTVLSLIFTTLGPGILAGRAEEMPTFAKDVAPILFDNCVSCHRPGDIAPMSFLSYQEVRPWSRAIKDKVVSREMPPWHASPGGIPIRNVRRLTQEQIDTIVAWTDGGAPQGDAADLPPSPRFADSEWHHPSGRPPDHILPMPVEMDIPAEGELPYFTLYSELPFDEDIFAEAIEMLPSNRSVVHHLSAHVTTLPEGTILIDGVPHSSDGLSLFSGVTPWERI